MMPTISNSLSISFIACPISTPLDINNESREIIFALIFLLPAINKKIYTKNSIHIQSAAGRFIPIPLSQYKIGQNFHKKDDKNSSCFR